MDFWSNDISSSHLLVSDEIIEKIHEAGFRIAARKETTLSKEIAEEFYGDHKDKPYYNDLVEHMTRLVWDCKMINKFHFKKIFI